MSHFIQLHILTPYAAANLNRDDAGRPKIVTFGGSVRLRISSQSLKRAFRTSDIFRSLLPDAIGTRSANFMKNLVEELQKQGLSQEEAGKRAEAVITQQKLGAPKKGKTANTEQLVHLAPEELRSIQDLAGKLSGDKMPDLKDITVLSKKPRAADIAMFGRMLADASGYNVEAAVQVAHAFTTHRATPEDDFYTAVDDIKNADDEADRGAGFLSVQEFGAGLFYLYICINASLLLDNLSGDKALAKAATEAMIRASTMVSPSGKQNAFASRSRACYVLEEIGTSSPRSLAAAFMTPIDSGNESDYLSVSVERLETLRDKFAATYGDNTASHVMNLSDQSPQPLAALIQAAQTAIDKM